MILAAKVQELKEFIRKWSEHKIADVKLDALFNYLTGWEKETRHEMGLPSGPLSVIGTSVDDDIVLDSIPVFPTVQLGFYSTKHEDYNVEVTKQDETTGIVFFTDAMDAGFMDAKTFLTLFKHC